MTPTTSREDMIRSLAYRFWEEEGRPEGRAEAHWLRAINILSEAEVPATPATSKRPAPKAKTSRSKKKLS